MKKFLIWFFLLCLTGMIIIGLDNRLCLTEYSITNSRIPESFDGYRIAVVSDLHAETFGEKQRDLIAMLQETECDFVCLLGDVVSHDTRDFSPVWDFLEGINGIPIAYVAGNNELLLENYDLFLSELERRGVTVLDDVTKNTMFLSSGDDTILIHGYPFTDRRSLVNRLPVAQYGFYNILLYHDPYCFEEAALLDYDLMISGHMHGGIIRLPLIGSPLEVLGAEPYTKGVYTSRAAVMIVSGGLGSHESLFRFYNAPEVVIITLKTEEHKTQ